MTLLISCASRKPPARNYPWYDEGRSPLGHVNSPVLIFDADHAGERLVFPFRMADGRNGEKLYLHSGSGGELVPHAARQTTIIRASTKAYAVELLLFIGNLHRCWVGPALGPLSFAEKRGPSTL